MELLFLLIFLPSDIQAIQLLSSPNGDQTQRNPDQVARDLSLLDRMTLYCEQRCQCRRSMMLEYFGEVTVLINASFSAYFSEIQRC